MGGIDIGIDLGARRREAADEQSKREQLAAALYPKLTEQYTPEETSAIVRRLINGEGINLPTQRARLLPPSAGVDVPTRSVLEPIQYEQPTTTFVDPTTGKPVSTVKGRASAVKPLPTPKASAGGSDPKAMDTANLRAYHSSLSRQLENEIPGTPEYQNVADQVAPVEAELNARLKRSSVQPKVPAGVRSG